MLAHDYSVEMSDLTIENIMYRLGERIKILQKFVELLMDAENRALELSINYYNLIVRRHSEQINHLNTIVDYYGGLLDVYRGYYDTYNSYLGLFEQQAKLNDVFLQRAGIILKKFGATLLLYKTEIERYSNLIDADNVKLKAIRTKVDAYRRYLNSQEGLIQVYNSVNNLNTALLSAYEHKVGATISKIETSSLKIDNNIFRERAKLMASIGNRRTIIAENQFKIDKNSLKNNWSSMDSRRYQSETLIESLKLIGHDLRILQNEFKLRMTERQNNTNVKAMNEAIQRNLSLFERSISSAYDMSESGITVIGNYISGIANSVTAMLSGIYESLKEL
jgi:hypothetical protein